MTPILTEDRNVLLQTMDIFIGPAQENSAWNTATMKGSRMYTFYGTRKVWKLKYFQKIIISKNVRKKKNHTKKIFFNQIIGITIGKTAVSVTGD